MVPSINQKTKSFLNIKKPEKQDVEELINSKYQQHFF